MSDAFSELELFVACAPGLEELLAAECRELGATEVEVDAGGVTCTGDLDLAARLNVGSGVGLHVLLRLARFTVRHLARLRRVCDEIDWAEFLRSDVPYGVRAVCRKSKLYHSGAVTQRVAAAIEEQLGAAAFEPVSELGPEDPLVRVKLRDDVCTLSLDLSGAPLHRRGWRLQSAKAPLREDLAWAMVRASGWQPASESFVDPFCGSGTLPISAALWASGRAPNERRGFALERTSLGDPARAARALEAVRRPSVEVAISGSDRDAGAIEAAWANAERAGVQEVLGFECRPFSETLAAQEPGYALVTNPPFGGRIGGPDLPDLFRALGDRLRRVPPARGLVLCSDPRPARHLGLPTEKAFRTEHGGLPVSALALGRSEP